jgi:hypothetical protein
MSEIVHAKAGVAVLPHAAPAAAVPSPLPGRDPVTYGQAAVAAIGARVRQIDEDAAKERIAQMSHFSCDEFAREMREEEEKLLFEGKE